MDFDSGGKVGIEFQNCDLGGLVGLQLLTREGDEAHEVVGPCEGEGDGVY